MGKSAREQVPGGRALYLDMLILMHVKMEMSPNGDGICGDEHNVWKPRKEVGLEISKE